MINAKAHAARNRGKYFYFTENSVRRIARQLLPACPDATRSLIVFHVLDRQWRHGIRLPVAVMAKARAHARHSHTDYETLLDKHKMTQKEARMAVHDEVEDILQSWQTKLEEREAIS